MKVTFRYRDASNYKTFYDIDIDLTIYPDAKNLCVGDEIEMGEYGTIEPNDFFQSETHPHKYDFNYDHTFLNVDEIH